MRKVLTQAGKAHDANRLHDRLIAAGLPPVAVESDAAETRFDFAEGVSEGSVQAVIDAYSYEAPPPPADLRAIVAAIAAVDFENSTTLADMRAKCVQLRNRTVLAFREVWKLVD